MPQLLYYLNVDKNTEVQSLVDESNTTNTTTSEQEQEKDKVKYSLHNQKDEVSEIILYFCLLSDLLGY